MTTDFSFIDSRSTHLRRGGVMHNKEELIHHLISVMDNIKRNKKDTKKIKDELAQYGITGGIIQKLINNPQEELYSLEDDQLLFLFTEQVYLTTSFVDIQPEKYFTTYEIKQIKTSYRQGKRESIDFPYTFKNAIKIEEDHIMCRAMISEIINLFDSGLIHYNPETQREAKREIDRTTGTIITVPKANPKRVNDIRDEFLSGQLISSTMTLNARLLSSDDGEEIIFNEKDRTLTVTKGTLLDIIDGYHRLLGTRKALSIDPELDMAFSIRILNYDKPRAEAYFAQMNKFEPVSESRIIEASPSTNQYSDLIARMIGGSGELRGKVAPTDRINHEYMPLLITFKNLSKSIEKVFEISDRVEAVKIANYLTSFFNELIISNPEPFITNIVEVRKVSMINRQIMFYGWMTLAKKFYEDNIELSRLQSIVSTIDFDIENPIWKKFGITNDHGHTTNSSARRISNYFESLLEEMSVNGNV